MDYKIILIVGLPGSGKSYYIANNIKPGYTIVDDPRSIDELPKKLTTNLVIADCHLCKDTSREALNKILEIRYPKADIEYIFFENNPAQCIKNVNHRNDGRYVEPTIKNYSRIYNIPENSTVLKVFDTESLKIKKSRKIKP